jgi:hypothetical protein
VIFDDGEEIMWFSAPDRLPHKETLEPKNPKLWVE